jgi:hypothetical protein
MAKKKFIFDGTNAEEVLSKEQVKYHALHGRGQ